METSEEELLENVTDESGNSYMIQRMTVDNGQLLSTEILQTPNGLVVDLGGDFIPVNYSSEDLLPHDITEEDRNLAAALVAVQFSHQQKQQQTQQDGVIVNTSLPSLLTTLDGKVQLGEQQVLLQDKQTGFLQIVDAEELYKQDFAKFDENTQQLHLIKTEEIIDNDNAEPTSVKKILPHKKRIPRKLKKNEKTMITNLQKCSFCSQYISVDEFHNHEVICQSNMTSITNQFACQICSTSFADQLEFFEHLKKHYEPTPTTSEKEPEPVEEMESLELEMVQNEELELADHITILKTDEEILQDHQGTIIKIEGSNEEQKETFLNSILQLTCLQCNRVFRRQKFYEAHIRDVHGSRELSEFSEPEDLMAGINVNAGDEETEIEGDTKAWYRDDELHATEEDLKELEAKEHVCQNCSQQFLDRGSLIDHMISCTNLDEEEEEAGEAVIPVKIIKVKDEFRKKTHNKRGTKSKMELECDLCNRKFLHRNSLVYHLRSHTEERPYQCDQCGKSFFAASALKVHLRLHSGEKPYRCEFCGRHFRQWGDLKYHCISLHSEEKQYQCEYCGKEFARKYSLIVHRRIHTGEKNYRCEFCGKTFRASSYLQNHRRIHTGEKPHACEICGKRFRVRSDMKRHLRTHSKTRHPNRVALPEEEMKVGIIEQVLTQESEDTSESMTLLKEENVAAVESLQYEQDGGLESVRDANTLYVHMPILIT